jgi:hypothetical protein
MNGGLIGSAIVDGQLQEDILGSRLGIFDVHVEISVGIENACIDDLEFGHLPAAGRILSHQSRIRIFRLWIFVEHPRVAVGRHRIEIVVKLLDILAVIALPVAQTEKALLQDRVLAVPKRDGNA